MQKNIVFNFLGLLSLTFNAANQVFADQGIGHQGIASQVNRTVKIDMQDSMRFSPDKVKVNRGETIRFVIGNLGALKHEFVLGTLNSLKDHNEMMQKHEGMSHTESSMVTVMPGQTAEIIWKFDTVENVYFACLQPGHYAGGMKGLIKVKSNRDDELNEKPPRAKEAVQSHENMHH